jgi:leucyl aminopeptidase
MKIRLLPAAASPLPADLVVCFAAEGAAARSVALQTHRALAPLARRAQATGDVKGEFRKARLFHTGDKRCPRLLTVGIGKPADLTAERVRRAAAVAQAQAEAHGVRGFTVDVDSLPATLPKSLTPDVLGRALAEGVVLGAYKYIAPSKKTRPSRHAQSAGVLCTGKARAEFARGFAAGVLGAEAACYARDLENAPANLITPTRLAQEAKYLAGAGVRVRVLERADLRRLRMGAFLGVAQGSTQPPKLIVLDHAPAGAKHTVCVVGKGLTFDTGGISIKPAAKMEEMRYDMCGGGAVLGLFHAIKQGALRGARRKMRVVGVIPATENMPGSNAQRPGDVVTACDGTTIEVLNTDAEGRLVLADAIAWAKRTYQPEAIVDLATLTGAVVSALGHEVAAILGNNDALVRDLIAAGSACDEPLWQLPLFEVHKNLNKSKFADLANLPSAAAGAGTIAGAAFLAHFAEGTSWAHLDIAGTAWGGEAKDYYSNGASGTGVRTLLRWLLA